MDLLADTVMKSIFESTMELLPKRTIWGLDIKPDALAAVCISAGWRSLRVEKSVFRELPREPQKNADALAAAIRELHIGDDDVIATGVSSSKTFIRNLELPFSSSKKISKIIDYQMEPLLPFPVEEASVDFAIPEKGNARQFAAAIKKDTLDPELERYHHASIRPDILTIDEFALAHIFLSNSNGLPDSAVCLVWVGAENTSLQVIDQQGIWLFRRFFSAETEAICNTLQIWAALQPGIFAGTAYVTGSNDSLIEKIADALTANTKWDFSKWFPYETAGISQGQLPPTEQSKTAVALGLAISGSRGGKDIINFLQGDYRLKRRFNLRQMGIYSAVAMAMILLLLWSGAYLEMKAMAERNNRLSERIREIFIDAFPDTKNIIKGQEKLQMQRKIDAAATRFQRLGTTSKNAKALAVLHCVTRSVTKIGDIQIDEFSLTGRQLRIQGSTKNFDQIDRFQQELDNELFDEVRLIDAKAGKPDSNIHFHITMNVNGDVNKKSIGITEIRSTEMSRAKHSGEKQ